MCNGMVRKNSAYKNKSIIGLVVVCDSKIRGLCSRCAEFVTLPVSSGFGSWWIRGFVATL